MDNLKVAVVEFLNNAVLIQNTLSPLKTGACILLNFKNQDFVILRKTPQKLFAQSLKSAAECDIEFEMNLEAARHLLAQRNLDLTDFTLEMIKQASLDNLNLRIHKSFLKLMRLGYFNILQSAGAPFWKLLSEYGLGSISKINAMLHKFRA